MGSGGRRSAPGVVPGLAPATAPATVCLPREVLFGGLRLSEVRAYALLVEAADEGVTAAELDAALGLDNRGNARRALAALADAGLASVSVPAGRAGRGAVKRYRSVGEPVGEPVVVAGAGAPTAVASGAASEAVPGAEHARPESSEPESSEPAAWRPPGGPGAGPEPKSGDGKPGKGKKKAPKTYDPVTEDCLRILAQIPDFPDNRTNVARKLLEYQCTFRTVDPIRTCIEYVDFHEGKPEGYTENHLGRLHRFFVNREKWNEERAGSASDRPGAASTGAREESGAPQDRRRRGAQRRKEGYEWLFGEEEAAPGQAATGNPAGEEPGASAAELPEADPGAQKLKDDLVARVSEHDGRNRSGLFATFVPVRAAGGGLALVCPNEDFPPYVREQYGHILAERQVVVLGASEYGGSSAGLSRDDEADASADASADRWANIPAAAGAAR